MPDQRRGRRQIEALARLRVAMPPAGSTPTHDSIAEPQALHFSRVSDSASRWVFVYQREAPTPPLPGTCWRCQGQRKMPLPAPPP